MDAIVESLPDVENGELYVKDDLTTEVDYDAETSKRVIKKDGNVMTKAQVSNTNDKGWTVYDHDYLFLEDIDYYEDRGWNPYAGILLGDANGDGEIGMPDVMFTVNYILGTPDASFNTEAADANLDGEVGMPDVMFIVNYILNGKFPEE